MVRKLLSICLMAFITISCDNDFEDTISIDDSQKQIESNSIVK